ncbi:MAG: hypothetical protein IJ133_02185 [Clostridia bacterium]|nr:hypothetical protein [Clostridia bacterium]
MNRFRKTAACLALALTLFLSLCPAASAKTYTNVCDLYEYEALTYNQGKAGPICITQGVLYPENQANVPVYVISLAGLSGASPKATGIRLQSTGIPSAARSALGHGGRYEENAVQAIRENIPKGSHLILLGEDLGAAVAIQLAKDPAITRDYTVEYVLAYGADTGKSTDKTVVSLGKPLSLRQDFRDRDTWGVYDAMGVKGGKSTLYLDLNTQTFVASPLL